MFPLRLIFLLLLLPGILPAGPEEGDAFFEAKVRPLLLEHCQECHGEEKQKGGLRLDSRAAWEAGGESGAVLTAGDPEQSRLITAVRYQDQALQMPPKKKLSDGEIRILEEWVRRGAPDPREGVAVKPANRFDLEEARKFWAFQPVKTVEPPVLENDGWPRGEIDRFILAKLREQGLTPKPEASRRTLIRRLFFDLTGLPPSPEQVEAFLSDDSPDAMEKLVEALLASPHYGERWGRWWLDAARYADTNGQDENKVMANAWRYRDWVIQAFNDNKPFSDFIVEQLAGDLLPESPDAAVNTARLTATGFLVLGPKMLAEQDKAKLVMDIVDEQIDTTGRAFMGLTLGCARCHDHKFDPVTARDYYALAGIFKSTRVMENLNFVSKFNEKPLDPPERLEAIQEHAKKLKDVNDRLAAAKKEEKKEEVPALEKERDALAAAAPAPATYVITAAEDKPADVPVMIRGSHLNPAPEAVPRGFVQVVTRPDEPPPVIPPDRSGRLELARWLTSPEHPLTSRVIVNRLWQAHFGTGIVASADNFGPRGDLPTHPELLDWLAREFVRSGWDVKALHRRMVLSAAWRQTAVPAADLNAKLLAGFPRQRLEAEMIRDALLAASGTLDRTAGGSLTGWKNDEYTPPDTVSAGSRRRSVYLPVVRDNVSDFLAVFDFANPGVTTARRTPTVVAHQALFFLNSPLVKDAAAALAREFSGQPEPEAIAAVYLRILNRPPDEHETARAVRFLKSAPSDPDNPGSALADFCQTLFATNEFIHRN